MPSFPPPPQTISLEHKGTRYRVPADPQFFKRLAEKVIDFAGGRDRALARCPARCTTPDAFVQRWVRASEPVEIDSYVAYGHPRVGMSDAKSYRIGVCVAVFQNGRSRMARILWQDEILEEISCLSLTALTPRHPDVLTECSRNESVEPQDTDRVTTRNPDLLAECVRSASAGPQDTDCVTLGGRRVSRKAFDLIAEHFSVTDIRAGFACSLDDVVVALGRTKDRT